jgi:hypothetical protein
LLIEAFVPGVEVALEAIVARGELRALAIFDKPDPLDGPIFEETIYVTPSRQPAIAQERIVSVVAHATKAMGLIDGPVHAELRLPHECCERVELPVVIEVAARSIGGLCGRMLRFGTGLSLEEVIIRNAVGREIAGLERERRAAGAMMIPIPTAGVLKAVDGVEDARAVPLVEDVVISIAIGGEVVPLPEGASYLGFLFAHGDTPEAVEAALREAHAKLRFTIVPKLATS